MDVSEEAALPPFIGLQLLFKTTVAIEVRGDAIVSQSASVLTAASCFSASTRASFSLLHTQNLGISGEEQSFYFSVVEDHLRSDRLLCHVLCNDECEMLFIATLLCQ